MAEKKDQHFVPKCYLRKFSYQNNKKQIGVFNLESKFCISTGKLKSQAYKKYHYGEDLEIENILGEFEGLFANYLRRADSNMLILKSNTNDYKDSLLFTLLTDFRTPSRSQDFKNSNTKVLDEAAKDLSPKLQRELREKYTLKNEVPFSLAQIEFAKSISSDLKLKMIDNTSKLPFISSDYPVVRYNQFLESHKYPSPLSGYGALGLQIFYPLTPRKLLLFYDSSIYKIGDRKQQTIEIKNDNTITEINKLQFVNGGELIFFNHEVNCNYISKLEKQTSKFGKANQIKIIDIPIPESKKRDENDKIIGSIRTDARIGLKIDQIKTLKKAKKMEIDLRLTLVRKLAYSLLNEQNR